jgi:hypothetical protein
MDKESPMTDIQPALAMEELEAESAKALPSKEVMSLIDLNVDLNAALDLVAPIDLAVAANANVAAPIEASVGANVLSYGSHTASGASQATLIEQHLAGDATATAPQDASVNQLDGAAPPAAESPVTADGSTATQDTGSTTDPATTDATTPATTDGTAPATTGGSSTGGLLDGNLIDIDVKANIDANLTAPVAGAVAANANAAAPIDASASANVGTINSDAVAISDQTAVIHQDLDANATATADQTADVNQ